MNLGNGLFLKLQQIRIYYRPLLRRGRLITKYKFGPLAPEKANALMSLYGIDCKTAKPMTLAEIFYHQENDFTSKAAKTPIGYINHAF
jgi:hypothetical protein